MLRTERLTKRFGGLTAVNNVEFALDSSECCAVIGPNGAGKTTLFNLLTGTLEPTSGSISLMRDGAWSDITGASPERVASLGVHRSFQLTSVFEASTVLENVRIAEQAAGVNAHNCWRNVNAFDEHVEAAHEILERVGLADQATVVAETLSHGEKRTLEIAIALAGDPDVLLLDEPNAGVSSESVGEIIQLIEDVASDHAVVLIEHNMEIVMSVSDRVLVLNQGQVIANDEPAAVRGDETVQKAYLGGYERGDLNTGGEPV
ncbi:ABC transporter ATP-binding protein [Halocatena halophila]|uniref:ABC transporter ATP-binding protein n=1 Tax=Halocatena halophila TaxID=2814576 RepID=UPI002ED454CF